MATSTVAPTPKTLESAGLGDRRLANDNAE
jgi:hypothetical protein